MNAWAASAAALPPAALPVSDFFLQTAIVYYDLETTGLDTRTAETIEIAAQIDPGCKKAFHHYHASREEQCSLSSVSDAFSALICPASGCIPEKASQVNGIYMDPELDPAKPPRVNVRGAPSFEQVAEKWLAWLRDWRKWCPPSCKQILLVAHNNFDYDSKILLRQLKQHALSLPDCVAMSDSLPSLRHCFPFPMRKFNMQALITLWCKDQNMVQDHRAASDVRMLIAIVQRCPEPAAFIQHLITNAKSV